MFKLRYYLGDTDHLREKNRKVLELLEKIKRKHNIEYVVYKLRLNEHGYVDELHEKEVYEKHFKPRARILKQRIGDSIRHTLRSVRGHYYIAGTIALTRNGQVEWYTCYESCEQFKEYDEDYTIGFLKAVLVRGEELLKELCPEVTKTPHDLLVDEFIRTNPLRGTIHREVKVGTKVFKTNMGKFGLFDWRKSIDLVVYKDKTAWIIEVKPRLNWEAFGQVIAYEHLFKKENPSFNTKKCIVCMEVDPEIIAICKEFDITVYVWKDGKFYVTQQ